MSRPSFYLQYAFDHLRRERQRTLFVLFCIAVGVAAVVGLRTLGLMIGDALENDLQISNRADIKVAMPTGIDQDWMTRLPDGAQVRVDRTLFEVRGADPDNQTISLSRAGELRLRRWVESHGFQLQAAWTNGGPFTGIHKSGGAAKSTGSGDADEFIQVYCVEPQRYPFYGAVLVNMPAGASLSQVLSQPRQIAVSEDLAGTLGLQPGDTVSLTGIPGAFTVSAIVSSKSESSLTNLISSLFPFVYLPYSTCADSIKKSANIYYIRVPAGQNLAAIKNEFLVQFPGLLPTTTEDLHKMNQTFSDALTRLVTVMGLVSLMIGGIGIANTMLVAVSRRSLEIAVLKTIGVQAGQITWMFLVEALILGVVGSLAGVVLGLESVSFLRGVGERFVGQVLSFTLYPQALGLGVVLGVVTTLAFSLLPILSAGQVRPNLVLHPEGAALPRSGQLLSLLVLLGLASFFGWVVGQFIGDTLNGFLITYGLFVVLGLAMLLLQFVIWAICHLPVFGNVWLSIAQRALNVQKGRAASTLLALVVGIFSLSVIWVLVQGTLKLVVPNAEAYLGGNVMVTVQTVEDGKALERKLARLPGVIGYAHDTVYLAEIVAINGDDRMDALMASALQRAGGSSAISNPYETIRTFVKDFDMKVREEDTWPYTVARGRDLQNGQAELLLESPLYDDVFRWFDLKPGDTLTLRFADGARRTARIVGITAPFNAGALLQGLRDFRATDGIVPGRFVPVSETPIPSVYMLQVEEKHLADVMDALAVMPGVFMVETRQFNAYTERFSEQFVPLPLIIAALALFASSVIIANTVALAVLERRRQIGIMKAIGLQTEHVLGLLLVENGLVGLLGGLLGTSLGTAVVSGAGWLGDAGSNLPYDALAFLVVLSIGISLAATLVSAWPAAQEKPLNVLRYE